MRTGVAGVVLQSLPIQLLLELQGGLLREGDGGDGSGVPAVQKLVEDALADRVGFPGPGLHQEAALKVCRLQAFPEGFFSCVHGRTS